MKTANILVKYCNDFIYAWNKQSFDQLTTNDFLFNVSQNLSYLDV